MGALPQGCRPAGAIAGRVAGRASPAINRDDANRARNAEFDQLSDFIRPVVNQNRRMHELADSRPSFDWAANIGKPLQQIDMVEKGASESLGGIWEIHPGVI